MLLLILVIIFDINEGFICIYGYNMIKYLLLNYKKIIK